MTDQPTTMAVVLPGKYGQVNPERFSGEVVQQYFFVYPFWHAPSGQTMYGVAHVGSGQPITMRATRTGALWCIKELETLPIGWHRNKLGDAEWDAIRGSLANQKAKRARKKGEISDG